MTRAIQSTSTSVRWLYAATLLGGWLITRSLWVGSFKGSDGADMRASAMVLGCAALVTLWRAFMVFWRRSTLDAPPPRGFIRWLRCLGVVGMGLGLMAQVGSLALPWILANLRSVPTEALGAVSLVAGLFVLVLSASATVGLSLFEFSRLLAFEQALRDAARELASAFGPTCNVT